MKHPASSSLCLLFALLLAACGGGGGSGTPVAKVSVTPPAASVMAGEQIQLTAVVTDDKGALLTGHPVTWISGDAGRATVSATGLVTAISPGPVTITAASDGRSDNAVLTATTGHRFTTISAGRNHTCGVTPEGTVYCWGDNSAGQLGNGTLTNTSTPTAVSAGLSWRAVSAGGDHTCGVTTGGAGYCWGDNSAGQLGNGTTTNSAIPVAILGGLGFGTSEQIDRGYIEAGDKHSCALTASARVAYCWGDNHYGQLGDGTTVNRSIPVAVVGLPGADFSGGNISAGSTHTCEEFGYFGPIGQLAADVYCWGDNSAGQLGNGSMTNSPLPVLTEQGILPQYLSAGTRYTCTSGMWCWGDNSAGQFGNGTTVGSAIPVPVSLSGQDHQSIALATTGALHACGWAATYEGAYQDFPPICWGDNQYGQLGNGTTTSSTTPVAVAGSLRFSWMTAGSRHTCGLTFANPQLGQTAGAAYCWGDNSDGQLGNNWTTTSTTALNVAGPL